MSASSLLKQCGNRVLVQSKLCLTSGPKTDEERDFMLFGMLKMIFMEQVCLYWMSE